MKLLHVDSSILGASSASRELTAAFVKAAKENNPRLEVISRDLAADPIGHLSGAHLAAMQGVVPESKEVQSDLASGQAALEEFLGADVIVIGAPMYNFTIPTQLKTWIDRLSVAGKTFRYTEKGPEGLVSGKKVIVMSSRGGKYADTPLAALDHQESLLKTMFGFFGITDITVVRAEGVAMGPEQRSKSVDAAMAEIAKLAKLN